MILLESVTKHYPTPDGGSIAALDNVDLEVREGETLCLIGGSGSGKTTALRLMNHLVVPDAGEVRIAGEAIDPHGLVSLRRRMGYVVQGAALFPHLTAAQNVGLLCDLEGWSRESIQERVAELMSLVRMPVAEYGDRFPSELSGGQRQRIGVARALALDPPIVLLDEPFGALDPITRRELQNEFLELSRGLRRTMVLVTHDLEEAFVLGDRVALLEAGQVLQVGTPQDLRDRPQTPHVAEFVTHNAPRTERNGPKPKERGR